MRDTATVGVDATNLEAMSEAVTYQAAICQLIAQYTTTPLPAHAQVLDFGAGRGDYACAMHARYGQSIICFEPDRALHQAYPDNLPVVADIVGLAPFDAAYSLNVFEHIEDDASALQRLAAACRPGARILLFVPALPSLWTSMDTLVGHRRRYTPSSLKALACRAGLTVIADGWFDRVGYFATKAYQLMGRMGLHGQATGAVSPRQIRFFDFLFRHFDPVLRWLPFGKNCWIVLRVPEH